MKVPGARIGGNHSAPKFECGPGPAAPGRIARVSLTCIVAAKAAQMKASTDSASPSECRACEARWRATITRWRLATPRWPAAFLLLRRAEGGGTASRASALLEVLPPAIPFRESPVTLAQPQSFGPARNFHVSLDTLSVTSWPAARPKTDGTVQKLWTMKLPCGSARKSQTTILKTLIHSKCFQ